MRAQLGAVAALSLAGLVLVPAPSDAASTCAGKRVTIHGTAGDDVIRGTSRADVIDGDSGNDVISGLGGNDTICGGEGADDLRGNAGNDRLYGGADEYYLDGMEQPWHAGDKLRGGAGDDTIVPGIDPRVPDRGADVVLYDTAPRGVSVDLATGTATGEGNDRIVFNAPAGLIGSRYADRLVGTARRDEIAGGWGADRIWGGDGNDAIAPGGDNDQVWAGAGDDWVDDVGGDNRLVGGAGADRLVAGGRGRNTLEGGEGDDRLVNAGTCVSGAGDDRLLGQGGNDSLTDHYALESACAASTLDGGPGIDWADVTGERVPGSSQGVVLRLAAGGGGIVETEDGHKLAALLAVDGVEPRGLRARVHGSPSADFVIAGGAYRNPSTDRITATPLAFIGSGGNDGVTFEYTSAVIAYDGGDGTDCLKGGPASGSTLTSVELMQEGADPCPGWPPTSAD
jgi:hypothetical protein